MLNKINLGYIDLIYKQILYNEADNISDAYINNLVIPLDELHKNAGIAFFDNDNQFSNNQISSSDLIEITTPIEKITISGEIGSNLPLLFIYDEYSNIIDKIYSPCNMTEYTNTNNIKYIKYQSRNTNYSNDIITPYLQLYSNKFNVIDNKLNDIQTKLPNEDNSAILNIVKDSITLINVNISDIDLNTYETKAYFNANSNTITPLNNYTIYYTTLQYDCNIYCDQAGYDINSVWLQIRIFKDELFSNSLYIGDGSRNTLPTESNKFQYTAGNVLAICVRNTNAFNHIKIEKNALITQTKSKQPEITLTKISNTSFNIIIPNESNTDYLIYDFSKTYKEWEELSYLDSNNELQTATNIISSDYWNNYTIYSSNNLYVAQGNSNFIVKVDGETKHIGNDHGNEVTLLLQLLADGKIFNIDDLEINEKITCSVLELKYIGNVYSCGNKTDGLNQDKISSDNNVYSTNYPNLDENGNPVLLFEHHMNIRYEIGNKITVNNKLIVKKNNVSFEQCHGVMLQCYYGTFDYASCNNAESTINKINSDGSTTIIQPSTIDFATNTVQKCNKVEMYGDNYKCYQEIYNDDPTLQNHVRVKFQFYNNRLKCYFQPIIASGMKTSGDVTDIFNIGDIISCTGYRVIDI